MILDQPQNGCRYEPSRGRRRRRDAWTFTEGGFPPQAVNLVARHNRFAPRPLASRAGGRQRSSQAVVRVHEGPPSTLARAQTIKPSMGSGSPLPLSGSQFTGIRAPLREEGPPSAYKHARFDSGRRRRAFNSRCSQASSPTVGHWSHTPVDAGSNPVSHQKPASHLERSIHSPLVHHGRLQGIGSPPASNAGAKAHPGSRLAPERGLPAILTCPRFDSGNGHYAAHLQPADEGARTSSSGAELSRAW